MPISQIGNNVSKDHTSEPGKGEVQNTIDSEEEMDIEEEMDPEEEIDIKEEIDTEEEIDSEEEIGGKEKKSSKSGVNLPEDLLNKNFNEITDHSRVTSFWFNQPLKQVQTLKIEINQKILTSKDPTTDAVQHQVNLLKILQQLQQEFEDDDDSAIKQADCQTSFDSKKFKFK